MRGLTCLLVLTLLYVTPTNAEDFRGRILIGSQNEGAAELGWEIFTVAIDRYTPDAEHAYYLSLIAQPGRTGQSELSQALEHVEAGRFHVLGKPSAHMAWIRSIPSEEGGRVVVLVGTRRLSVDQHEIAQRFAPEFTMVRLDLDNTGEGEGVIYENAILRLNDDGSLTILPAPQAQWHRFRIFHVAAR